MINYPQIGKSAPNFLTVGVYKKKLGKIRLSDYRGKKYVILVFYPANFTPVSPTELIALSDRIKDFRKLSAQILAISVDSPFTLAKFKEEQGYNFLLLSDFNKEVSRAYGSLYEDFVLDMKGVSKRSAFVIDKEGTIKYVEVLENAADIPNFEAVKDALAEG